MANQNVRSRYVSDGAGVVPPARLLVMLYDRLVLDLEQADTAIVTGDIATANESTTLSIRIGLASKSLGAG